ncbi:MAG TPA: hypothetical protein VMI54_00065 [Polyangiaceae bacterium]|nr:hypothetical protein [Polyangiaceae bacterium]
MSVGHARRALLGALVVSSIAVTAHAQNAAPAPSTAAPPVAAPEPAPVAPAPPASPRPAPSTAAAPPGYMLVPIPQGNAETRYDVQYPQTRGALPPGMELPYEDGDPVPPGYRLLHQRRRGLIIAGSIVTGVPWALGLTVATSANFGDNSGLLVVPVLGPWLMLATNPVREDNGKAGERGVLVLDGLMQGAGAAMFFAGMFVPRVRLVRSDVVVSVVPLELGHGAHGLGAVGTF